MKLDFRAPGGRFALRDLLHRVAPSADAEWVGVLVAQAAVEVGGRAVYGEESRVEPGERVRVFAGDALLSIGLVGQAPEGAWSELLVLAASPPWRRGVLGGAPGARRAARTHGTSKAPFEVAFEVLEERGGVAVWRLRPSRPSPRRALDRLAKAGFPALGDVRNGGILVAGGLHAWGGEEAAPPLDAIRWPEEPVYPQPERSGPPELRISHATARALGRGHPWILRDPETGDAGRYAPGTVVELRDPRGTSQGRARIEGTGELAARLWTAPGAASESVESRVARALERRRALLDPPSGAPATTAYRLVHGEADGLPGVSIDRLGPLLRVIENGRSAEGFRTRLLDALRKQLAPVLADPAIVLVLHGRDPRPGAVECVRVLEPGPGLDLAAPLWVEERGLRFRVEAGLSEPDRPSPGCGLYLDQRANRDRLAGLAAQRGGRWLNLFAHTGAFSAALLAAGAREVVSVDLSGRYLGWLEENLHANADRGVSIERHRSVRMDGRRYLLGGDAGPPAARDDLPFDGIVLDPPTSAAAGRHFFSVARDLEPLVAASLGALAPGGVLLLSRNQRRGRGELRERVGQAARLAGVALASVGDAPPGPDFPRLRGFPEGDAFRAVLATRR